MKVYFVSGLGADYRVFKYIQLPEGYETIYIPWIKPTVGETLTDYALRLAKKIDTSKPFVLIGLSMGGMIVSEIARIYPPEKLVLISSIPSARHLPVYFKWVAKLKLQQIVPVSFVKSSSIAKRFFTTETKEDKALLKQVIKDSDDFFIRWAMNAIVKWECMEVPSGYMHIHGSKDEVLPLKYAQPTHVIPNAGHMLIMTHATVVNELLKNHLTH